MGKGRREVGGGGGGVVRMLLSVVDCMSGARTDVITVKVRYRV